MERPREAVAVVMSHKGGVPLFWWFAVWWETGTREGVLRGSNRRQRLPMFTAGPVKLSQM